MLNLVRILTMRLAVTIQDAKSERISNRDLSSPQMIPNWYHIPQLHPWLRICTKVTVHHVAAGGRQDCLWRFSCLIQAISETGLSDRAVETYRRRLPSWRPLLSLVSYPSHPHAIRRENQHEIRQERHMFRKPPPPPSSPSINVRT